MRDLLTDPLWRAEDLGLPLPASDHACSVCLPTWASVIGYEENDPAVTGRMQAGYPRFFCHPQVAELFARAEREFARPGEKALVFPTADAVHGAARFIRDAGGSADTRAWQATGLHVLTYPATDHARARLYWRFAGQVVSSRRALLALRGEEPDVDFGAAEKIRERLSELTGQPASHVFLFASGMAAVFATHQTLSTVFPGRKSAQIGFPYVDVLKVQQEFGAGGHFFPGVGVSDLQDFANTAQREPLAGVFCEIPSNPLLESVDLERVARFARKVGLPVVVDDTVASVANVNVYPHADLVTTSLTKAFSGAGDVMAGCVVVNRDSAWAAEFCRLLAEQAASAPLEAADAVVLEQNSRDFPERVGAMSRNAHRLADFLQSHPAVERVWFPTLTTRDAFDSLRRPDGGHGMLLSFVLGQRSASAAVFDALQVCKGPSLGTNFTLACPYTLLAHYPELEWAEACGVDRHLIRVSTGIEATDDILRRFERALAVVS